MSLALLGLGLGWNLSLRRRHDRARRARGPVRARTARRLLRPRSRASSAAALALLGGLVYTRRRCRLRSRSRRPRSRPCPALWLVARPVAARAPVPGRVARFRYNPPRRTPVRRFSVYEDLQRQARRDHARLVPRRRRGQDPRPARDPDRRHAARQAQAAVHAARRHRRLRRSSSTRRRSRSRATSSTRRCTTATPAIPAGCASRTLREQLDRRPTEVLRKAVKGMLPKNRLARQQITKLKIYAGPEHPHGPQNPRPLNLEQ